MLLAAHRLLDKADVVIHYNGTSFDIPTLNKEFVTHEIPPPSPYKQVDLLLSARKQFRFPSNKLDYVAKALKIGAKVRHTGFEMWVKCMAGDATAWKLMERYNRKDVTVLEALYNRVLPWIDGHPNVGTHEDKSLCPTCGSSKFQRRGLAITRTMRYPRYQCRDCGRWFRGCFSVKQERKERFTGIG